MLSALHGPPVLAAASALGFVLLLILLLSRGLRFLPAIRQAAPKNPAAPALRGSLALDSRRRLHLVEVEGHQALVLTGGGTDVMLRLPPPC